MKINRIFQEPIPKEFVKNLMKQYFFILKAVTNIVRKQVNLSLIN